ncbi:MAG: DUF2157 domain-containing protein [Zoogloeaceae bacterium]|jgi:uncharacterized membrane protein|nr:DUF2157 domain-containing protein [Zoogloeaceae bacterium]
MAWRFSQIGQIFELAEHGWLHSGQVQAAARLDALRPDREAWLAVGMRVCAYAGTLLLASAIIFFFAYNWAALHRFAKIGLAGVGILAGVAAAAFSRPFSTGWRAALFGASLCTGALLALIGQIYQTGADIWELFAAWALLMTPFALLARSSANWFMWLVVVNTALLLTLHQHFGYFEYSGSERSTRNEQALFMLASFNLLLLLALERWSVRLLARARRHLHRLSALAMLLPLTFAVMGWILADELMGHLTVGFFMVTVAMFWFYSRMRHDLVILAITGFTLIIVTTTGLTHWLFSLSNDFAVLNLVALYFMITTGALAVWLKRLHRSASTPGGAQGEAT